MSTFEKLLIVVFCIFVMAYLMLTIYQLNYIDPDIVEMRQINKGMDTKIQQLKIECREALK